MISIPEIILLNAFKKTLKLIRDDYNSTLSFNDTTKSILYRLLNGNDVQRYKLFEQAVAVLITKEDSPRHLDINLFFNAKRATIPTLHITLPSESQKDNALGISEGFQEPVFDEIEKTYITAFNRRFTARYNIIITTDNSNEIILLYHFFRSILISLIPHLNLSGLENIKQSGGDIQINSELVPINIFSRSLNIEFDYDVVAYDLFKHDMFIYDPDVSWNGVPEISSNGI